MSFCCYASALLGIISLFILYEMAKENREFAKFKNEHFEYKCEHPDFPRWEHKKIQ